MQINSLQHSYGWDTIVLDNRAQIRNDTSFSMQANTANARVSRPESSDLVSRRRSEILTAARKVFAEHGYHGANISDIANKLHLGHGTIYRYFRNKHDIFRQVVSDLIAQIGEVLAADSPNATDNLFSYREQAQRMGERLIDLFVNDEHLPKLIFYEALGLDRETHKDVLGAFDLFGAITEGYLQNGINKRFLRADLDVRITALALNALLFEAVRRISRGGDRTAQKQRWIRALDMLIFQGVSA